MKLGAFILLTVILLLPPLATIATTNEKPLVVCTTTVLGSIVSDLTKGEVIVEVIASPSICPAHYDVKPSDVDAFRKASLILTHGFEPWVEELREASKTQAPIVEIKGPWNIPSKLKEVYRKVAKALQDNLKLNVNERLERCLKGIDETEAWLKDYASENGFVEKPIVCMLWQRPFLSYLGFEVVASFKPPEMVSMKEYEAVLANATREGAVLVVDNLQSGTELGEKIAREIGAVEVALTNFPGTAPNLNNVTQVMKYNAKLLAQALKEASVVKETVKLRNEVEMWKAGALIASVVALIFVAITVALALKLRKGR